MKYKKNQYTDGAHVCTVLIAAAFLWWGISSFLQWSSWWWGFISTGIGLAILSGQIAAIINRGRLRKAVKYEFESNPETSIGNISKSTGITKKDVQAIILDLKMRGELRGIFSTTTGKMEVVQESVPEEETAKFCPHCGTPIRKGSALFCAYCGAPFQEKAIAN